MFAVGSSLLLMQVALLGNCVLLPPVIDSATLIFILLVHPPSLASDPCPARSLTLCAVLSGHRPDLRHGDPPLWLPHRSPRQGLHLPARTQPNATNSSTHTSHFLFFMHAFAGLALTPVSRAWFRKLCAMRAADSARVRGGGAGCGPHAPQTAHQSRHQVSPPSLAHTIPRCSQRAQPSLMTNRDSSRALVRR